MQARALRAEIVKPFFNREPNVRIGRCANAVATQNSANELLLRAATYPESMAREMELFLFLKIMSTHSILY